MMRVIALAVVLVLALVVCGCKAQQPETATPPTETTAPQTDSAVSESPEAAEEVDPVEAARKLGTPTENEVVTMDSGLKYIDVTVGEGGEANAGQMVSVHYTGWLVAGSKFDSSVDRGQPFEFPLGDGRVIKGWDEGVAGMKIGGVRKLIIPSDMGYGSRGAGPIPPDSTLIFEVELLGVK